MLASHAWLQELTGLDLEPGDVAKKLTSAGIEVEGRHAHGAGLDGVVVAEVRALRPHPKRDKLRLVTVRHGQADGAEQEVVCGAPNVPEPGGLVALARLGAKLPGGLEIAERELGGVVSAGMLCSERELGIGTGEEGILILGAGADRARPAPGTSLARALSLRDIVYELSLTPNRPDCLGHVGLARELCALYGKPFALPAPRVAPRLSPAEAGLFAERASVFALPATGAVSSAAADAGFAPVSVELRQPERCPRYGAALVHGVTIAPSPFWLRYRLHVLGLRAINNVVDATNYVLMLWGHPIHAFDYAQLRGSKIVVRMAGEGERMSTLDGVERTLCADDLLICDAERPVALAGVMGGAGSEIGDGTERVLIECAYFDPRSVRRTSKRTGLHTDSSHRFERGVDPGAVPRVLSDAAGLIAELGGATAVAEALDVVAKPIEPARVRLRLARVASLLGLPEIDAARVATVLRALGCELTYAADTDAFEVVAPSHRPDLTREVDLIEELARLFGYASLPTALPRLAASEVGHDERAAFARKLREAAAAAGLTEAVNYAFVSPADLEAARAPKLAMRVVNPLSEERSVLRTSLLPGLARNLQLAQSHQRDRFAGFELARLFSPRAGQELPEETLQLGVLLWGERRDWYGEGVALDFYDLKGALEAVLQPLAGARPSTVLDDALDADAPELHPRRRARIRLGDTPLGWAGELHPDVVQAFGLSGRPLWAVLDADVLRAQVARLGVPRARALPRFPAVTRDLALVVDDAVAVGDVESLLLQAGGALLERVALFDLYRGEPVAAGRKSLALHLVYRDPAATLTDKVVDDLHAKVQAAAEQAFGAALRR